MKPAPVPFGLLLSGALALASTACAPANRTTPPVVEADGVVIVERAPEGEGWTATWRLSNPVTALRFDRPSAGFRSRVFRVLTPGWELAQEGDFEVIRGTDQAREIRVWFPEYDEQLSREYEFFRRFTDGGIALYTGHLLARPLVGDSAGPSVRRFRFVPPAGARILVEGRHERVATEWTDESGGGTYVYIGPQDPLETRDMVSIVDPGLPPWIEDQTREVLPRLFALYRQRLGAEPARRPTILFDYEPTEGGGYSNGGGTLPGVIQLSAEGRAWEEESPPALLQLLHFLAHEAAHVWNGEIARYPGREDAWMHEGSADALAERTLLELGVLDQEGLLAHQTAALNDCRLALTTAALRTSVRQGRPRMAYTCGNVIALLTEARLSRGQDLFDLWRSLIRRAREADGTYDAEDYRAVWRELGADESDVAELDAFLDGSMTPDRLTTALRRAGITVRAEEPSTSFRQSFGRNAMAHLMAADCGGRVGFRFADSGFLLDDGAECGALRAGARVTAFDGAAVLSEGHRAYDALQRACASGTPVRVTMDDGPGTAAGEVPVSCTRELPTRPAFLRIVDS